MKDETSMRRTAPRMRSFHAATRAFRSGDDTPRIFLERCLEAVAEWEPRVGAFTVLESEGARRSADAATARWAAGRPLSAIDGMPVGIKDIIDTGDMPTQQGSSLYRGHRPPFDAASVTGLRLAGAVVLGKTVTTEFASRQPGGTRNPWDLARTPGGSSSGSAAAVGAGMVPGALGTQVVGSIIRPAGFCGAVGYKPTVGGINRGGSLDLLSQSCSGVLAASLGDAWAMAREIVARVGGDPGCVGITGPMSLPAPARPRRLALLRTAGWPILDPTAREALEEALASLRSTGVEVVTGEDWPELREVDEASHDALDVTIRINAWEWRWPLAAFVERDAAGVSQSERDRLAMALAMTPGDYAAALTRRAEFRRIYARLADKCDGLVSVTAPGAAPLGLGSTGNPVFVVPGSMLGVPVVTLPVLQSEGLPLGLQLLGFADRDAALFGLARGVEAILA